MKIQDVLTYAEELARISNNSKPMYVLDVSELKKFLPRTGMAIAATAKELGGTKIGENEYMFDSYYGPERLARDRKSTRLNSSHEWISRMPSSA